MVFLLGLSLVVSVIIGYAVYLSNKGKVLFGSPELMLSDDKEKEITYFRNLLQEHFLVKEIHPYTFQSSDREKTYQYLVLYQEVHFMIYHGFEIGERGIVKVFCKVTLCINDLIEDTYTLDSWKMKHSCTTLSNGQSHVHSSRISKNAIHFSTKEIDIQRIKRKMISSIDSYLKIIEDLKEENRINLEKKNKRQQEKELEKQRELSREQAIRKQALKRQQNKSNSTK